MSSNKSAHLGLHLWQPEDNFLRTEFNENSERIDELAGAARYVTLLDVTTTAAAQQVDLDVSGIDFTALWEADLFCSIGGSYNSNDTFKILTNGLTTGYWNALGGDYTNSSAYNQWAEAALGGARSFKLLIDNPGSRAVIWAITAHVGPYNNYTAFLARDWLGMAPVGWGYLTTINFTRTSGSFPAGTRFFIRGVKR